MVPIRRTGAICLANALGRDVMTIHVPLTRQTSVAQLGNHRPGNSKA